MEVKLHIVMWPLNVIKNPNLSFVIPTFNKKNSKEKKSFIIDELDVERTFGQKLGTIIFGSRNY